MDRKYNIRLDLQFRCNNSVMKFRQSDNKTSDFFMRITSAGELFNIDNAIVILAVIKPNQTVQSQFLEVKEGKVYADLNSNMKDQVGVYKAQALLIYEDERVSTDVIEYEVLEDNILNQLEATVSTTEEFTMLQQMLSRLSIVENSENLRVENENSRVEAEKLREQAIEKIKNDATKLITDTKKEISDYKDAKDTAINNDLTKYKESTNQAIEEYKTLKNNEIDKAIKSIPPKEELIGPQGPKGDTGAIGPQGIQGPKGDTGAQGPIGPTPSITHLENKVNEKMKEVDASEQQRVTDHQAREQFLNSFESQLAQIENKNIEQDTRLKEVDRVNKTQQVYINGLFNENKDGRLSIEGEGNSLKLEGSKSGLVEIDKVVGNTFVNLSPHYTLNCTLASDYDNFKPLLQNTYGSDSMPVDRVIQDIKPTTTYTIIYKIKQIPTEGVYLLNNPNTNAIFSTHIQISSTDTLGIKCATLTSESDLTNKYVVLRSQNRNGRGTVEVEVIAILEGDYTNKPIPSEVFEGLQSSFESNLVTREMIEQGLEDAENLGKYKVPVRIVGKNKFDINNNELAINNHATATIKGNSIVVTQSSVGLHRYYGIKLKNIKPNTTYIVSGNVESGYGMRVFSFNDASMQHNIFHDSYTFTTTNIVPNDLYLLFYINFTELVDINTVGIFSNIQIKEGTVVTDSEEYFERITNVYLNSPLLEGDEIVEYNGELYHYHTRKLRNDLHELKWDYINQYDTEDSVVFNSPNVKDYPLNTKYSNYDVISDKFIANSYTIDKNIHYTICLMDNLKGLRIRIPKSVLTEISEDGLKTWLQQNKPRVIYPLAEPYYEKISDDKLLLECANDSTIHIESIVPVENIVASYTTGIPNAYLLQETNDNQDSLIDISLCATDEMYMMLEPILEAMPQTINERMISKMVDMYVAMVIRGLKTIEEVPVRYRKEVQNILDKLEK